MQRDRALQDFADAILTAYQANAPAGQARASLERIAVALDTPAARRTRPGKRLPVCSHLDAALAIETDDPVLRAVVDTFRAIEPSLEWQQRASFDASASANFLNGHANAMIIGPAGLEHRNDIWIGASLMAPFVRYTDHAHAPEETYLALSEGDFRQGDSDWFTPGIGGSFYNRPWITHAMRSGAAPLFAFWALWIEPR